MVLYKVFSLFFFLFPHTLMAQDFSCGEDLKNVPILANGRVKPFRVHAYEKIKQLELASKKNSIEAYCQIVAQKESFLRKKERNKELFQLIEKLTDNTYVQLSARQPQFTSKLRKFSPSGQRALRKLLAQIKIYQDIQLKSDWKYPLSPQGSDYISQSEYFNKKTDYDEKITVHNQQAFKYRTELTYFKYQPFTLALLACFLLSILAGIYQFSEKKTLRKILGALSLFVFSLELWGIVSRVIISGRAPVTNMYETVFFSGLIAFIISFIFFLRGKKTLYFLGGVFYNTITLFMIKLSGSMLDGKIDPLVPVLRDNFWLSTHVTTVVSSYGAFSLSWIMGNIYLIAKIFDKEAFPAVSSFNQAIYNTLKIAVVLLSTGIILGGIWADYSWGRFWGWDPKETWSLIVLLAYMIILHGKKTSWIRGQSFIYLSVIGFSFVMMAWFGVNYILSAGLHSYGFGEEGMIFLLSFFSVQSLIFFTYFLKRKISP